MCAIAEEIRVSVVIAVEIGIHASNFEVVDKGNEYGIGELNQKALNEIHICCTYGKLVHVSCFINLKKMLKNSM